MFFFLFYCICVLKFYQTTSVDATALRAFSRLMLSFRQPLPRLETYFHPCRQTDKANEIKLAADYADLKEQDKFREDDKAHFCFVTS